MPGEIVKEYVLIDSNDRTDEAASTDKFTVHLFKPLKDVIKTDLVMFNFMGANGDPLEDVPFFVIQSRELGTPIRTASNTFGYWRLVPGPATTTALYATSFNTRVDPYLDTSRTIQDIDITLLNPDGTSPVLGRVTILVEIERRS